MAGYGMVVRLLKYALGLVLCYVTYCIISYSLSGSPKRKFKNTLKLRPNRATPVNNSFRPDIEVPILLWWTGFTGEKGAIKQCGDVECFMTIDRKFANHPQMKVFLWYGTDFKLHDLPLPRQPHHEWALLHEESPKNVYLFSFEEIVTLFNHTATFRRWSHYPLTTQWLSSIEFLESKKYVVSTEDKNRYQKELGLAPIVYVQSDCGAPSDRDMFVKKLMKYIPIDSYGKCVHNKDLPEHLVNPLEGMDHDDFYKLMAKYKFTITIENALCEDYITEKFWRPLHLGSVPIVYAPDTLKDYYPSPHSVISAKEFRTFKELATYLLRLNSDDGLYNQYLKFKTTGVTNSRLKSELAHREWSILGSGNNLFNTYPCHLCKLVHKEQKMSPDKKSVRITPVHHYGCPMPKTFLGETGDSLEQNEDDWFAQEWLWYKYVAEAFRHLYDRGLGKNFTYFELLEMARPKILKDFPNNRWLDIFERNVERGLY